jgi:aldose 1-epimerase
MKKETNYSIASGRYRAEISETGAALAELVFSGADIIEKRTHERYFSGEVLAPWPNRIANGKYSYGGHDYRLDINEANRNNALHGLVFNKQWQIISNQSDEITLTITIDQQEKYPGTLELRMHYKLNDSGLSCTLTATNNGKTTVPYGASTHPYISVPGLNSVDDFQLQIGSNKVLLTDAKRLLPTELVDVAEAGFDFRTPRYIGKQFIDHAFLQDPSLPKEVSVTSSAGNGVVISFSDNAKWIQIHTADRNGGEDSRKVLAVEPMTCPPDSFNSGVDLTELQPGESHQLFWQISGI